MKIVTIIENLSYSSNLAGEHGLSIYIETNNKKILFDTGLSGNFINNANELSINIEDIDYLVISHGHYDHTGGLYHFIKKNKKALIYIKKEAFQNKYKNQNKFIGIPFNINLFNSRLVYTKQLIEIEENIFIVPQIEIFNNEDTHFENFYIKKGDNFIKDNFRDEQFIIINKQDFISILTSCSHRGITNIIETAKSYFNKKIDLILGGFHLENIHNQNLKNIIDFIQNINPERIGYSHCSHIDKFYYFKEAFKDKLFYNYTGKEIIL